MELEFDERNEDPQEFITEKEAFEHAKSIGKYDSEIAIVDGKPAFLSSTELPLEERLREPAQIAVTEFLDEIHKSIPDQYKLSEIDKDDAVNYIGAKVCETIIDELEKYGIKIISAGLDY